MAIFHPIELQAVGGLVAAACASALKTRLSAGSKEPRLILLLFRVLKSHSCKAKKATSTRCHAATVVAEHGRLSVESVESVNELGALILSLVRRFTKISRKILSLLQRSSTNKADLALKTAMVTAAYVALATSWGHPSPLPSIAHHLGDERVRNGLETPRDLFAEFSWTDVAAHTTLYSPIGLVMADCSYLLGWENFYVRPEHFSRMKLPRSGSYMALNDAVLNSTAYKKLLDHIKGLYKKQKAGRNAPYMSHIAFYTLYGAAQDQMVLALTHHVLTTIQSPRLGTFCEKAVDLVRYGIGALCMACHSNGIPFNANAAPDELAELLLCSSQLDGKLLTKDL
ncbi:hypothetical protein SELMODRAFT_423225 [Selaginella moellendorffii]|uniref:Uncharacterized protein n=1 Tax=Selaginella moellendorffii TaxID=88036 RepID=D8SKZ5_SELML|nr:hypothetical protein SELMODRAFT_423225 [Selaginella moellendorffii]